LNFWPRTHRFESDAISRGFLSRARPHARTGHITPMGPIFSPSANFFCSSLNEA
jgi:hypothetical protein